MSRPNDLVACSSCGCHAKSSETECPHCGARLRGADGTRQLAAAVVFMGLTTIAACGSGSTETDEPIAAYGPAPTGGEGGTITTSGAGGAGGAGGSGGSTSK